MRSFAFILFLLLACAELAVLVKVADLIGPGETILLTLVISASGVMLVRRLGRNAFARARQSMQGNEIELQSALDGVLRFLAALLLIVPGFLTDIVAIALLVPQIRRFCTNPIEAWLKRRAGAGATRAEATTRRRRAGPVIIEGEATEITPQDHTPLPPRKD